MKNNHAEVEFDLNNNQGKDPISLKESARFCFIAMLCFIALSIIGSIIENI